MPNPTTHVREEEPKKSGPSGSTDKTKEREQKFDEEGGDQPQAPSEKKVEEELRHIEETKD